MTDLRASALARGVLGNPTVRDEQGRLTDFWSEVLEAGDRIFVCAEDGSPEVEVLLEHDDRGGLVGVPTGVTRACVVERD